MSDEQPREPWAATPAPIRAAATINVIGGAVLALLAFAQVAFGLLANDHLTVTQGDVILRSTSAVVWLARFAVILCAAAGAFACGRAFAAVRSGAERAFARACLLGACGGLLGALPALGSMVGYAFRDELNAPLGSFALRLLTFETFGVPSSIGGGANSWTSISVGRDLAVPQFLWLWPVGITIANVAARALSPQLTGALDPRDRRRIMIWIAIGALVGAGLPFVPTTSSALTSGKVARRYVQAVLAGEDPATTTFGWIDCPEELRRYSPTDLRQITGTQRLSVAQVRLLQTLVSGPGEAAGLQKYRFAYHENGFSSTATWVVIPVEITLTNGTVRTATLALSKHTGDWRVVPRKR